MIKSRPNIETNVWTFWEISSIVLGITVEEKDPIKFECDLSLEEAKKLCEKLQNSIRQYEEIDCSIRVYCAENPEQGLKESGGEYTEEEFLKRTSPELVAVEESEDSILAENRRLREQVRELSSGLKDATSAVLKLSVALLVKMGKIKRLTKTTGDLKRELSYWEGKCLLAREALVEEEDEPKPPVRETK